MEPWLIGLLIVGWVNLFVSEWRSPEKMASLRLARLERKIDLILAELGIEYSETIEDLVKVGDRIGAVKKLREETGVELTEALHRVQKIEKNIKRLKR